MKRLLLPSLLCFGGLFLRLHQPALWQDEAETALLGLSVLAHGTPKAELAGSAITVEPTLRRHETDSHGNFIWNTWLPYYLAAGSMALFGANAWAARLPFALLAFLGYLLMLSLLGGRREEDERALEYSAWWLACSVPWLLFMRQCRYYSLVAFGALAAVWSYRALLEGRRGAAALLVASLLLLLHSSFAYGPIVLAALCADACLRREESTFQKRFWPAVAILVLLAIPTALHFRIWSRPGIHAYAPIESLRFLRTFLSWLSRFALPLPLLLAILWAVFKDRTRNPRSLAAILAAGWLVVQVILDGEGLWADAGSALLLAGIGATALSIPAAAGELSLGRISAFLCVCALAVLSWSAAEPYGRYLVILLPFLCAAGGAWVARLTTSRLQGAALLALLLGGNLLAVLGGRAAALVFTSPLEESVSGMMRRRIKDLPVRSELWLFWRQLLEGRRGYVEPIGDHLLAFGKPNDTFFSDADNLSLLFYTRRRALLAEQLGSEPPDWIIPSPWLMLDPPSLAAVQSRLKRSRYDPVELSAPATLWQDNPDILFHSFRPRSAPRLIYRLRSI